MSAALAVPKLPMSMMHIEAAITEEVAAASAFLSIFIDIKLLYINVTLTLA